MKTLKKSLLGLWGILSLCACSSGDGTSLPKYIEEELTAETVPVYFADSSGCALVNCEGKQVGEKYFEIGYLHEGLAVFAKKEYNPESEDEEAKFYGYLDSKGNVAIEPVYASASSFSDGLAWVAKPDSTLVAIDKTGAVKIRLPNAINVMAFINGYSIWQDISNNTFVIDKNGNNVELPSSIKGIPYYIDKYFFATTTQGDKLFTIKDNKVSEVEELAEYNLHKTVLTDNGVFIVDSGDRYGLINMKGEYVVNPQYAGMGYYQNLFAFKTSKDKIGLLDKKGNEVIPAKFKALKWPSLITNYLMVSTNGSRFYVCDRNGEAVGKGKFDAIDILSPTLFAVQKDDKFGILDATTGEMCCSPQFDKIMSNGRVLLAKAGGNYAVIDKNGKILNEEIYADTKVEDAFINGFSKNITVEQICTFIKKVIADLPLDVNAEAMAAKLDVSKFNLTTSYSYVTLKEVTLPSLYVTLAAQLTRPPLVSRGYRGRTEWNGNSVPQSYYLFFLLNDDKKCGEVIKSLADKYHISYAADLDFQAFSGCSSFMINVDATTGKPEIDLYIIDY